MSQELRRVMEPKFFKQADWLSFVLHFILGLIIGICIGLTIISRKREPIWLSEELILPYLIGASLIGGGFGAKLGDHLWIGDNYRIIPPDAPRHSRGSYYTAIGSIVLGSTMVTLSIARHFMK